MRGFEMKNKKKILGIALVAVIGFSFSACDNPIMERLLKPLVQEKEDNPNGGVPTYNVNNSWKWGEGVEFTVSGDIITVNVTQETAMDSCGVQFSYNGAKDRYYNFSFEAWAKSGTRGMRVLFGEDGFYYPGYPSTITITSTRQTYNLEYYVSGGWYGYYLGFNCGGDIGEFYIRIISIDYAD